MPTPAVSSAARRRRRIDVVVLVLVALVVAVATSVVAALSGRDRVAQLWITAAVADDGSARVTEVVDYDFGRHQRHGMFLDVENLRPSAPVEVSSPDAPAAVSVDLTASPARIRIGDPDRTVSGLHRYVVTFTVEHVVSGGRLAWDAVSTRWESPLENVTLHVTAAQSFDAPRCAAGGKGSTDACPVRQAEPGHLTAHLDALDAGQGVTLAATPGAALGQAPVPPPPPPVAASRTGTSPVVPGALAGLAALVAAAVVSRLVRRAGLEHRPSTGMPAGGTPGEPGRIDLEELAGNATPSPTLPAGLSPAEGGLLLAGRVLDQHKAAWLIDQAVAGVVDLEPAGAGSKKMTMVRVQPGDMVTGPLLDLAFRGRDRVTLGSYDKEFAEAWGALGRQLAAWQGISGLWDAAADARARRVRVLGALAALAGVALAVGSGYLSAGQTGVLPLALAVVGGLPAGAGAAAALRGWELRVFTPEGSAAWLQVESLRQFLAQSPTTAVDEVIASGQAGRYTAWAVALGEAERWSLLTSRVSAPVRSPYDQRGLRYAGYAPVFLVSCHSASVAPSSSGGGSGGVSVGGGAGGAGGGSW